MTSLLLGMGAGLVAVALYAFWRSAFRVDNGNIGVLFRFGRLARDTYDPGLHTKAPWVRAIQVSLAERSISVAEAGLVDVLAADGTRIRVNARLRFRVARAEVARFLTASKHPVEELRGLFRQSVRQQISRFEHRPDELSAYTGLRSRISELQSRTLEAMRAAALADFGIEVIAVDYLQLDPPEELVDALNAVITAESEANQLVSRAELESRSRWLSAEQAVEIANAHALAQEAEIRTVGAELATLADRGVLRDYVERRTVEVLGGSRRVYLNHNNRS